MARSSRVIKYQQVKESLAQDIEQGKYPLGDRLPSEKQLAEQFDVSLITIRQAIETLSREGYVEKIQGSGTYVRLLRPAVERKTWALIVPNLNDPWYPAGAGGMEEVARAAGVQVIIAGTAGEEVPGESIRRIVTMGVEALGIVAGFEEEVDEVAFEELSAAGIPFCFLGRWVENITAPRVRIDCHRGFYEGTKHLIDQGHERIALFGAQPWKENSNHMHEGYLEAMAEAGLSPFPEQPVVSDSMDLTDVYRSARDLLSLWPRPTAIVCTYRPLAYQIVRAADDVGLDIPSQLSVVSFGGRVSADGDEPSFLTAIDIPLEEMGKEGGKMLLRMMMGATVQSEVTVRPHLVIGRTTGPVPSE